jgi:hypothetical protein
MTYHFLGHVFLISVSGASAGAGTQRRDRFPAMPRLPHDKERREQRRAFPLPRYRSAGGQHDRTAYSDAMKASASYGLIWAADNVVKYLANPHQFLSFISALLMLATKWSSGW